jgi:hypothetical protein
MRKFLNITEKFRFEENDLRALIQIVNVALIMMFGLSISWFGLSVAIIGLIKDVRNPNRHLNDFLMHGATAILNIYFLILLYKG